MAGVVITIAQQKGGSGKTTLAIHLGAALASEGRRVAMLDIDPQGSLTAWAAMRDAAGGQVGPPVDHVTGWRTQREVESRARTSDIVIVDSPPHAETDARLAIRASDLVVVPVQPSPMDLWACRPTLDVARDEGRDVLVVLNRVPPRARLTDQVRAMVEELGVAVADTTIGNRVPLAASVMAGAAITDHEPRSRAADEIRSLAAEILYRMTV